jgi:hypothetical protein
MPNTFKMWVLAGVVLITTPAIADPVIYAGTLGKAEIVVELTDDPATASTVAGRYFYKSQGADIPLQARNAADGKIELAEEEACGSDKCGDGQAAPIAAVWKLAVNGDRINGTWNGKKSLVIALKRVATRPGEAASPLDLHRFTEDEFYGEKEITREASPFDYLRLDMPAVASKREGWPDAGFAYVTDPRTTFATPRIVDLVGGADVSKANALLQSRHWQASLEALNCKALQFAGFHQDGRPFSTNDGGTLGGYEDATYKVTALTPKLMSWRESGSLFCGGAHPYNFSNGYVMDVARGALLSLEHMFKDAREGKPGPSVVGFVKEKREKPSEQTEVEFEEECGTDELIGEYLAASFVRKDDALRIVFGLQNLPHAINACGDDLLEMPVAEAAHLLRPEFAALLKP